MALTSPGVQVTVIDESFYTPAEPGTRPLFIVASAANKSNGAGTGTAQGTLATNAGKVYLITSQRDLVDTFGDPTFKVDSNNNPIHAGEQNEYGLQAAYSYLGVSNSAFVVRADLDLNELNASADAPGGEPVDGTFWLDTATTNWGIFQWNGAAATATGGQSFTSKTPTLYTTGVPDDSVGAVGTYALVYDSTDTSTGHELNLYYKSAYDVDGAPGAMWHVVGSDGWQASFPVFSFVPVATKVDAVTFTIVRDGADSVTVTINGTGEGDAVSYQDVVNAINTAGASISVSARLINTSTVEVFSTMIDNDTLTVSGAAILSDLDIAAGPAVFKTPQVAIQPHTSVPQWKRGITADYNNGQATGSVWVKTTEPNGGARWRVKIYNGATQLWDAVEAPLYATNEAALLALDSAEGGTGIPVNSVYAQVNFNEYVKKQASFRLLRRTRTTATVLKTSVIASTTVTADTWNLTLGTTDAGSGSLTQTVVSWTATGVAGDATVLANAINAANIANIEAAVTADNRVTITHSQGGDIRFIDESGDLGLNSTNNPGIVYTLSTDGANTYTGVASGWFPRTFAGTQQSYYISSDAPATLVADGALWYSSVVDEVDLLVHNGSTWVGYGMVYNDTDPEGPIVAASAPTTFADGTTPIDAAADGQIWIDTSDLENYPVIKRWNGSFLRWDTLDTTDQTSENGVLFADARWAVNGGSSTEIADSTIAELWNDDFLDFDAPDPALYPQGMILWNLRRSGFNVKRFVRNYVDVTADNGRMGDVTMSGYYPHRWVTESGNQADGSGSFGRHAQRKVVIQALQALVNSNEEIRDTEVRTFNLLATPGYPELIGEMVTLNYDRGLTAFVVGDSPARLLPNATSINDWGNNVAQSLQDDDNGLVSYDEYLGVFYPWGFTSDNAGNDIAVPPSHMICRMIALNDQVAYPWFAPAGTRRGGITSATNVGYISSEGEFKAVALNEGQRDTLYNVKVNPITFFTGAGLVNFGQKTRARNASALDRINVARLVIYLRSQLNKLAKPYIFEPNDKITRDEIKQQVESLLLELVGQRALYDYLVVCDESNNTPNRIDRNELYVDIAIEPVKAVEFIYIPVRLKNTGEIAGLG